MNENGSISATYVAKRGSLSDAVVDEDGHFYKHEEITGSHVHN